MDTFLISFFKEPFSLFQNLVEVGVAGGLGGGLGVGGRGAHG